MARYLALYMGSAANEQRAEPDEATQQEGMAAWGAWAAEHQAAIVDQGAPLGKTLKVDQGGTSATSNLIVGYVVVEAATHEHAAAIFENHPHFAVFSGSNSVEVLEIMEMPGA